MISFHGVRKEFTIPHLRRRTVFQRLFAAGRYSYETFPALRGISFEVAAGEFVGVLGRNGSGKSTLLRLAAGIYHPSGGSVRVEGAVAPVLDLGVGFNAVPGFDNPSGLHDNYQGLQLSLRVGWLFGQGRPVP